MFKMAASFRQPSIFFLKINHQGMKTSNHSILNANQAVAGIAYKTNAVFPIYPITPASEMSELVEEWHAQNQPNCFGQVPTVFQMQSEAGVAGTMHGALQTGSLSSTFTSSQGLLLMLPNLYKIAGELTPNVIHVATRSIATHALSVFGDHSDVMAVRQSGYAMLGSASVQEAQDFALIAQMATLESRIPFIHFFDGFRTSHEFSKIETLPDEVIRALLDIKTIENHTRRALNPNHPVIRGTSQNSDVFFQSREAVNSLYTACPDIVQHHMDTFAMKTNRQYKLFEYAGHPEAQHVILSMASSTETIETTIAHLNALGHKFGLIKVRLFRPFSTKHLLEALPKTTTSIAVLDRTKEPGSNGEPLYLDIVKTLSEAYQTHQIPHLPVVVGGRYGLSSKEFTPSMVKAIYDNLKSSIPQNNFSIGIVDDVTHLSLPYSDTITIGDDYYQAIFYREKSPSHSNSFKNTLDIIGKDHHTFVQGYKKISYKKSNAFDAEHLRIASHPIKAPFLIEQADFMACTDTMLSKNNVVDNLKPKGTLLIHTAVQPQNLWPSLPAEVKHSIMDKAIKVHIVDLTRLPESHSPNTLEISGFHACFLAMTTGDHSNNLSHINRFIQKMDTSEYAIEKEDRVLFSDAFKQTLLGKMLLDKEEDLYVSDFPIDGTYPTHTSIYNAPQNSALLPDWNTDLCTQCGACSMACPQSALRIKVYDDSYLEQAPQSMKHMFSKDFDFMNYTIQINPEQCNGCYNCIDACTPNALKPTDTMPVFNQEKSNWNYFETIPEIDRDKIDLTAVSQQQLQEPLFKYSTGISGCGEAPYLKLMSQLFGDRLLIANATGASSIFGGALPTTPWAKNSKGQGPAWSNSLFEDNAEFGLGFRLSLNQQEEQAKTLLHELAFELPFELVYDILHATQDHEKAINQQRLRIASLKHHLQDLNSKKARLLLTVVDALVKKSVWIVGGDGWAYDIGYGGLDHVIATGENVNILVLDNEVYDNTGGQASKATPFGARAKFAFNGKQKQKKDLGVMAMNYEHVYVASVAIGANQEQTLKAFIEAECHDGPSIIIAYCHSDSHGIDTKTPRRYHEAAVNSGQWLLYRNDPGRLRTNEHPFQLDSKPPSIPIKDYVMLEKRFSKLLESDPASIESRMAHMQQAVDRRYRTYANKGISAKPGLSEAPEKLTEHSMIFY